MVSAKLNKIYDKLNEDNVVVEYVPFLHDRNSIAFHSPDDNFYIALNNNLKLSEREELCVLAEEKAHYDVGILPNDNKSNSYLNILTREKNEFRAKKLAVKQLVSKEKLIDYIKEHYCLDLDDMADYFDVTPKFMMEALFVYGLN